ncbi:hypothetical protein ACFL4D_01415 [Candidatus Margulisiibacteriota bacterium]
MQKKILSSDGLRSIGCYRAVDTGTVDEKELVLRAFEQYGTTHEVAAALKISLRDLALILMKIYNDLTTEDKESVATGKMYDISWQPESVVSDEQNKQGIIVEELKPFIQLVTKRKASRKTAIALLKSALARSAIKKYGTKKAAAGKLNIVEFTLYKWKMKCNSIVGIVNAANMMVSDRVVEYASNNDAVSGSSAAIKLIQEFDEKLILNTAFHCNNKTQIANMLKISAEHLSKLIKQYGLRNSLRFALPKRGWGKLDPKDIKGFIDYAFTYSREAAITQLKAVVGKAVFDHCKKNRGEAAGKLKVHVDTLSRIIGRRKSYQPEVSVAGKSLILYALCHSLNETIIEFDKSLICVASTYEYLKVAASKLGITRDCLTRLIKRYEISW